MKFLVAFLFGFLGSKLLFSLLDFKYAVFSEPFDIIKLLIGTGVFGIFFFAGTVFFKKFYRTKPDNGS